MSYVPIIGRIVDGRYRLEGVLGDGGMGAVYRARDDETGATVALKMIKAGALTEDATALARFSREARVGVASRHLARILGAGAAAETGEPYIVMEHLEGEDLAKVLRRLGPLPMDAALRIAAQACVGLCDAHAAGIVHRDIKPANLFLARQLGEQDDRLVVKVLDFGVAKLRASPGDGSFETTGLTRKSSLIGSPLYMAPEQVRGSKSVDHRADLWSLGVVLYRALAGRAPHQHLESLGELVLAVCGERPRPLSEAAPWVPSEVVQLVHRALQLDPDERYGSAAEMLEALRALLPDGVDLRPSMLRRLSRAERAPGGVEPAPGVAPRPSHAPSPPASTPAPFASETTAGYTRRSTTTSATTTSPTAPDRAPAGPAAGPRSLTALLSVAAIAVGLLAGFGARRASEAAPAGAGAVEPIDDPSPRPPAPRLARVVIVPGDAEVEVDGRRASVRDGAVEIAGKLDSVHRVRVARGRVEIVELVVVGTDGGVPAEIRLRDLGAPD